MRGRSPIISAARRPHREITRLFDAGCFAGPMVGGAWHAVDSEDRWVAGTETRPAKRSRRVVHHATTYPFQRETAEIRGFQRAVRRRNADPSVLYPSNKVDDPATLLDPSPAGDSFSEWAVGKNGELMSSMTRVSSFAPVRRSAGTFTWARQERQRLSRSRPPSGSTRRGHCRSIAR